MSEYVWGDNETQFFFELRPETILDAIDDLGPRTTGRCLTLNSMENRVYEVEVDDKFIVTKFYRPGRWSESQILDEHQFLLDLQENDVPVIAPELFNGKTLFQLKESGLFYTVFPKKGGRLPQEMTHEQLEIMGRMLARLHNVGATKKAENRITISPKTFGMGNLKFLMDGQFLPPHVESSYKNMVEKICILIDPLFENVENIRIHGDCHLGNIIWREGEGPFFIDFDDMLMGPPIQDIWLVTPGMDEYAVRDRNVLIESYKTMRDFDNSSLKLIEPLRTLRYIHFSAWIAKRWKDPAFQVAFPYFNEHSYWDTQLNDLQTQYARIENSLRDAYA